MSQITVIHPAPLTKEGVLTIDRTLPVSYPKWVANATYAKNDRVTYGGVVYYNLNGTTSGAAPPNALWAVFTATTGIHTWAAAIYALGDVVIYGQFCYECIKVTTALIGDPTVDTLYWRKSTRDYPYWEAATNYTLGDRVTYKQNIYKCNVAGTATTFLSSRWTLEQKANAWLMFDGINLSLTQSYDADLKFTLRPDRAVGALALTGISATSITVLASVIGWVSGASYTVGSHVAYNNVVYQCRVVPVNAATIPSSDTHPTTGHWTATSAAVVQVNETVILTGVTRDLIRDVDNTTTYYREFTHLSNLNIVVTLTKTNSQPQCGTVVVGAMQKIGDADSQVQYGATVSTVDSTKDSEDEYGTITLIKRSWKREINVSLLLPNDLISGTQELIAFLRATPCMWRVSDISDALLVYGIARNFSAAINYHSHALMTLKIKGYV